MSAVRSLRPAGGIRRWFAFDEFTGEFLGEWFGTFAESNLVDVPGSGVTLVPALDAQCIDATRVA